MSIKQSYKHFTDWYQ